MTEALFKKKKRLQKEDSGFQPPRSHLLVSSFVAIGIHGRQEVDPGLRHQPDHTLVALLVLLAQVLHEVEDELPAEHLVAVHPRHVAKLRLSCRRERFQSVVGVNVNVKTQHIRGGARSTSGSVFTPPSSNW